MMKTLFKLILLTTAAFILVSCPSPMTEDIVLAASDKLAPSINVISPGDYDIYYSDVEFQAVVADDAISEGDSRGDIASISFSLSNDVFRGGKIDISSDGSITQDTSYGTDSIHYNKSTGAVDFSFSTIEPNIMTGLLSVTISVSDRNGNETEQRVSLDDSEGPDVNFTIVNEDGQENLYLGTKNVFLQGNVFNSKQNSASSSDIKSISWNIANNISAGIIADPEETYTYPYTPSGEVLYYNSATGLYENKISGYLLESDANTFTFDPASGEINATIFMKTQLEALGTVSFSITAEDRNGHETTKSVLLAPDMDIPDLSGPALPLGDGSYGHVSRVQRTSDEITVISDTNFDELTLGYQFKCGTAYTSVVYADTSGTASNTFEISIDPNLIKNTGADPEIADDLESIYVEGYPLSLIVLAEKAATSSAQNKISLSLIEDNDGPELQDFDLKSSHSNTAYANSGHSLDLSFKVHEERMLIDNDEISVDIQVGGYTPAVFDVGNDYSYSNSNITAWSTGQDSDDFLDVVIVLKDRLGNTTTETYDDAIMYYNGSPTLSSSDSTGQNIMVSLESSNSRTGFATADDTVTFTVNSGREMEIPVLKVNNIDAAIASGVQGDKTFSATVSQLDLAPYSLSDDLVGLVPFTLALTDMAGNEISPDIDQSNANLAASVVYDNKPPDPAKIGLSLSATAGLKGSYINSFYSPDTSIDLTIASDADDYYDGYTYAVTGPSGFTPITQDTIQSAATINIPSLLSLSTNTIDGPYSVAFTFYDEAGNASEVKTLDFTVDRVAPAVSDLSFNSSYTNSKYATEDHVLTLNFRTTDDISLVDTSKTAVTVLSVLRSSTPTEIAEAGVNGYAYTSSTSGKLTLPTGFTDNSEIPFVITVEDYAGNQTGVDQTSLGTDQEVYLYSEDKDITSYLDITFSGSDLNADADRNVYWVEAGDDITLTVTSERVLSILKINDTDVSLAGSDITYPYTVPDTGLSDNETISFKINLTDMAGNSDSNPQYYHDYDSSNNYSVKLDSAIPDASKASIDINGTGVYENTSNSLTYLNSASGAGILFPITQNDGDPVDSSLKSYSYSIYQPDASILSGGSGSNSFGTDIALPAVSDSWDSGVYTLKVSFQDYVGNDSAGTKDFSFTVDRDVPGISSASVSGGTLSVTFDEAPTSTSISATFGVLNITLTGSGTAFTCDLDAADTENVLVDLDTYSLSIAAGQVIDLANNSEALNIADIVYNAPSSGGGISSGGLTGTIQRTSLSNSSSASETIISSSAGSSRRYSGSSTSSMNTREEGRTPISLRSASSGTSAVQAGTVPLSVPERTVSRDPDIARDVSSVPVEVSRSQSIEVPEDILADYERAGKEFDAALEDLRTVPLAKRHALEDFVSRRSSIVPVEVMTVSTTPFLAGPAVEIVVSGNEDVTVDAVSDERSTALLIVLQALVILSFAALSFGFVKVMKKFSRAG